MQRPGAERRDRVALEAVDVEHRVHVHFVRAAGRTLAIVGEKEEDVRAVLRDFATSVAAITLVVDPPRSG